MKSIEKNIAAQLLKVKAIKLQPQNPFIWASGWKSPIYCDNRKTLSYPTVRSSIKDELVNIIRQQFADVEVIAGVATGAIAQGALVAEAMNLPFIYVRSSPKDHGLENLIEGDLRPGQKVVIIEDLISTGGSSLKAVEAIRNDGSQVLGMVAIFSYGFPIAEKKFKQAKVNLFTLSNYEAVLAQSLATNYIKEDEVEILKKWRQNPETWGNE
ncbi:MAG: orotate phosphoribosyltransferase [Paludibacter sp.]|jgi:orotate phosphoribosyltransferase|nr:orotate phosphoribosyltransferase [Paludibacter sp.]